MSHRSETDVNWAEWQLTCDRARELAATMSRALTSLDSLMFYTQAGCGAPAPIPSDLVEWCRSARDILEAISHD